MPQRRQHLWYDNRGSYRAGVGREGGGEGTGNGNQHMNDKCLAPNINPKRDDDDDDDDDDSRDGQKAIKGSRNYNRYAAPATATCHTFHTSCMVQLYLDFTVIFFSIFCRIFLFFSIFFLIPFFSILM